MGHLFAFAGPALATVLSFVFWTHKNKVRDQKEIIDNMNKINVCIVELTTDIKQVHRFNEHFHGCIHEVKDRVNMIENRLWEHTANPMKKEGRFNPIKKLFQSKNRNHNQEN